MARSAPTLADVAAHVGVSRTTVSNAYNRPDQLSPGVRERVLAVARELGYGGPDPTARCLRRGQTGQFGLVFDHPLRYVFTDPAAVAFLTGVAVGCEEAAMGLTLVPQVEDAADVVRGALVDGFVLFCTPEHDERVRAVSDRGLPYVLVDYTPGARAPQVNVDDRAGARAAAQHLVDLGHRRFGIVLPYSEGVVNAGQAQASVDHHVPVARLAGWRDALEGAGIDWDTVPVSSAIGLDAASGQRSAARLLDRAERPTAILALADVLAIGVLAAAAEREIAVPAQLSVVGFDDVPQAAAAQPALTTIRQPHAEKGAAAIRLLNDPGQGSDSVLLSTELVVRASSGPVPS